MSGERPLMAARLEQSSGPLQLGQYDPVLQISVGADGQPLVSAIWAGLRTITEADSDAGDPADPLRALNSGSAARTDPPDPVEPPMDLGTLTKASGDPTDALSRASAIALETATRAKADTDDPLPSEAEGFGWDDMATGVVAF
jgi:hypothetical protein